MKVIPLAAESLGVRSMATYVEVGKLAILIDPGATLAAQRYGLPPAEEEWEAFRRANDRISAYGVRATHVFVSHYHEDHFRSDARTYAGKTVLVKDPRRMVGGQQLRRAEALQRILAGQARVIAADGGSERDVDGELHVSAPLPHGHEGTPYGSVVALTVTDPAERARFVFASDVQGPLSPVVTAWLITQRPTLLYLAGPPSYLEREVGRPAIDAGIENLLRIVKATGCRVILDHHALRDARFETRFEALWATGRVVTAAAFLHLAPTALESRRHLLWAAARRPGARAGARDATTTVASRPGTSARWPRTTARGGYRS
jgi:uncharacterized protein